jgi:hypothetical protein
MSLSEVISEIARFSRAQRLELLRVVLKLDDVRTNKDSHALHAERVSGRLLLVGPDVIRQEQVDAILEEFP